MSLRRIGHSLMFRWVFMGLLLAGAGTAAGYVLLTRFLRDDLAEVISAQQVSLAGMLAREVDHRLIERRNLLTRLAATLPHELMGNPPALRDWLGERHRLQPMFDLGIVVADANGRVVSDFPEVPARAGASVASEPGFAAVIGGQAAIGRPRIGTAVKRPLLPMGAPIVRDGKPVGVLIGISELTTAGFLDLTRLDVLGRGGSYLLVSPQDRLFVAASLPGMVMQPTPAEGVNPLHDRAMQGYRGPGLTVNAQGVEELAAIASVPTTGWFVVARIPTSEAFAAVARAQSFVIRGAAVAFVLIAVLGSLLIWWALRPLFGAAGAADRMTRGETPLAPLPVLREDEIGHLTAAFNRLLAKLDTTRHELEHQASHDILTGLPNRRLLLQNLYQALARARRNHSRLAVLFLDLDGFKPINDTLGHEAGDDALRQVSRRLAGIVRTADTLARVGGDEFVVLAVDLDHQAEEGMAALAQKCHQVLAEPLQIYGRPCPVGVSIGIAVGDGDANADWLLGAADDAMYEAKRAGRGRHVFAPAPPVESA